ncbi:MULTISPECIES: hypothetical protein [Shigella]|nr:MULTISPECIES: hypothetical protein [Shigella]EDX35546.1 hypothetical protein Sd1012_1667 [Shigella dysenteriae 1012]EGI89523.1 hypothetical protein SD15574_5006 [Shigella dysenteriae 155-74]EIQ22033.1 hypothetical protein SB96558_5317 [Shigella boydii 965-58]
MDWQKCSGIKRSYLASWAVMHLWLLSPARASAKRKVQQRFTTSCDCCVFVAH